MSKVILTENQLLKLIETAMDLDRFSQLQHFDTDNGNKDILNSIETAINQLKELKNLFEFSDYYQSETQIDLFGLLDRLNTSYEEIKYNK